MSPQVADLFSVAAAVLPVLACLVEWAGSVGISERHHSHHDTYVISSALSRSLYAYLLNFMDLKKAAQQLGIHRNTLEYQVRKMNAVIGKPPDGSKRFRMMCTYKMLALPDTGVHDV